MRCDFCGNPEGTAQIALSAWWNADDNVIIETGKILTTSGLIVTFCDEHNDDGARLIDDVQRLIADATRYFDDNTEEAGEPGHTEEA